MALEKRGLTFDDFWRLKSVTDVQLSPDGKTAAFVVGWLDPEKDKTHSAIWLVDVASGDTREFTRGEFVDNQPRWSPKGDRLAFVSTRHEDKPQIFVMPLDGGEPRRLTGMKNGAAAPVWSLDGARICVSSEVESDRQKVALEIRWLETHKEIDEGSPRLRRQNSLMSRFDARGYFERRAHLFIVDVDAGPETEPHQLTHGEWDDTEASWSPDGALIAFMSNRTENAEHNLGSDVWTVDVATGATKRLTNEDLTARAPIWSPDGETVAFCAWPEWREHGFQNTHVWTVSRDGGDERDVSSALDENVGAAGSDYEFPGLSHPVWSHDGETIYFIAQLRGYNPIFAVGRDGGEVRRVSKGEVQIASMAPTPNDETFVCLGVEPTRPFDVYVVPVSGGTPRPITNVNAELLAEVKLSTTERVVCTGPDGWEIEGWLIRPLDASAPSPLVLHVHGGPYGMYANTFYFRFQVMAALGYASLYLNPRGSTGYGQSFSHAADWGEKDYLDLMAGVDAVIERGDADPHRLGVTGVSYGGFMTNWIIGHTQRFAAAVSVNGVSSLFSMFGTSDVSALWFDTEFGGPFWTSDEQWERYRKHSPITYAGNITTPLLLIQSENDYRCPIEQGEQMLGALRYRGQTVELIRIPNASHGIVMTAAPRHRILQWEIAQEWFDRYVRDQQPVMEPAEEPAAAVPDGGRPLLSSGAG